MAAVGTVYLGTPGFEAALRAELGGPAARVVQPGVLVVDEPVLTDPVFARQVLPRAFEIAGASVSALAASAYAAVEPTIDAWPGPFTVHAFAPPPPPEADAPALPAARLAHTRVRAAKKGPKPTARAEASVEAVLGRRASLVGEALLALLAERRKRAWRRHRPSDPSGAPGVFDESLLLVQLLATARDRLLISTAAPRPRPRGGTDLSPWPAGAPPVTDDRAPPSRAYKKLEEAFAWMGAAPHAGQTCVDLGAAPGSWTMVAARRGARVVAVDRAPLAPAVARLPGVSSTVGNAFTYAPPKRVDWLLSDVVCEPARAIALIDQWLGGDHCANLVVTIKFKGHLNYGALAALEPILARAPLAFARVKQLAHNKNEVTVMIRRFS